MSPSVMSGLFFRWSERFGIEVDLGNLSFELELRVRMSCEARRRYGGALDCDKFELESSLGLPSEKMEDNLFALLFSGLAIVEQYSISTLKGHFSS